MASQRYPLHQILVDTEAFITTRPTNFGARLAFSEDTGILFFLDGNDWYEFVEGVPMIASSSSSQSSSSSSVSSQSSQSSSSQSSTSSQSSLSSQSSSSQSSSSSSKSSASSSSQSSSSSSAKNEIYPEVITHEATFNALNTEIDIYTSIRLNANIRQVFNVDIGYLELELTGLFIYQGTFNALTTAGSYVPLKGSYAISEDAGQDSELLVAPETGFISKLKTDKNKIVITDKNYQTINFDSIPTDYLINGSKTLTASASSGLPITFTSSDPTIASVSGSTLSYVGASGGTVTITASQAGNADFDPAEDVSRTFKIRPPYCIHIPAVGVSGKKGINVPYSAIQANVDFTMMWWQRLGDPDIANTGEAGTTYETIFAVDQGGDVIYVRYDGTVYSYRIGSNPNCPLGHTNGTYSVTWDTWQHFAITRNGQEVKQYLDGVEVYSENSNPNLTSPTGRNQYGAATDEANPGDAIGFRLGGGWGNGGPWPFGSHFNDFAIWDGNYLTGSEVAAIHADGFEHITPSTVIMNTKSGPTSFYRMGDDDFAESGAIRNVGNRPAPQRATDVGSGGESSADYADLLDQATIIPLSEV
tara:strand:+ start:2141 stop:3904 length:1764 start_codon:yes stop_codon:yes gene_type:complete